MDLWRRHQRSGRISESRPPMPWRSKGAEVSDCCMTRGARGSGPFLATGAHRCAYRVSEDLQSGRLIGAAADCVRARFVSARPRSRLRPILCVQKLCQHKMRHRLRRQHQEPGPPRSMADSGDPSSQPYQEGKAKTRVRGGTARTSAEPKLRWRRWSGG